MVVKFSEIASLRNEKYSPNTKESLPYIGLEHIEQQTLSLSGVGDSSDVISKKNRFYPGDILFGKLRPYFRKVYRPDFEGVCSTDIWVVRAKEGFDQAYLFYLMASTDFIDECNSGSSGTRMPRADWNYIANTLWEIPPLEEQKTIGRYLSDLDGKIELNRKTNQTLEEIAQAIFKEWFIDFNYPGATGEMIDSPLGPIPKGWRVEKLTSELEIVYGKNLPTSKLKEKGYPVFGGNGCIGYFERYIYEEPQVIVACRGAASGKVNQTLPRSFVTNNSLVFTIPESSIMTFPFLKYFCLNTDFTSYVSGSAQPQLTIEALDYANLLVPNFEILTAFTKVVSIIESKMQENDDESSTLSTIRCELLEKFMNGEIEV